MNKTLLLIICDFLLLNLLALTRWEEPPEMQPASDLPTPADTAQQVVDEDLVDMLRVTLEEQLKERSLVGEQLEQTQSTLSEREQALAERERRLAEIQAELERKAAEATQLGERVHDTQATVKQLTDSLTRAADLAANTRAQSEQLARELAEKQAAAELLTQQVQQLEKSRTEAQERIQSLSTQVQVADTERTFLRESVDTLRTQVTAEREEKTKLQEQTGILAEGVTQLAESSADLRQEIRSNTPINANTLFDTFLKNRLDVTFQADRNAVLRSNARPIDSKTILITDGANIVALFHINSTMVSLREDPTDWRAIAGTIKGASTTLPVPAMYFLKADPRVMVVPVDANKAAALGTHIYPTALEPFKFPEAVLVSGGGKYYGEVEFKLDPQTPGYVKMQTRILSRLFGEFAPSAGDLVFSKTGEILGVMVNNTYCAVVADFTPEGQLPFGSNLPKGRTTNILAYQRARVEGLSFRLQ